MPHPALLGGGVVATLDELFSLRRLAGGVDVTRQIRSASMGAGPFRSPYRGRGMDFDELRAYTPGDDPRCIDWRVTARTGRTHSKRFHEERDRPLMLLVDERPTMHFGTRGCFKSVAAARWAALVAWAGLASGHRVGGVVLSGRGREAFAPRTQGRGTRGLMQALADGTATSARHAEAGAGPGLGTALDELWRLAPSGSRIFVVSDFEDLEERAADRLAALGRRCDVACVLVYDPLEEKAPPSGRYRISDGRETREVSTVGERMRQRWGDPFRARRNRLDGFGARHRIPVHRVATGPAPEGAALESLARVAGRRS